MILAELLPRVATSFPNRPAIIDSQGQPTTFSQLLERVRAVSDRLAEIGLRAGDRVAVVTDGSVAAWTHVLAILDRGAAYIPVDVDAPSVRTLGIIRATTAAAVLELDGAVTMMTGGPGDPGLAYVLATSGSTGPPAAVGHTHQSSLAFLRWAQNALQATADDVFVSVAPFHFDLSILDLFLALMVAAPVVLPSRSERTNPRLLPRIIADRRVTVWYSTPTLFRWTLRLDGLGRREYPALRWVIFAGEVFPAAELRRLQDRLPRARMANWYGPTESNVVVAHPLPGPVAPDGGSPPIGTACAGTRARIGRDDADSGELWVSGPTLMKGYLTSAADATTWTTDDEGTRWLRTGDLVRRDASGDLHFVGRADRLVKRSGHRISLPELEEAIRSLDSVADAAVVAAPDAVSGVRITAFVLAEGALPVLGLRRAVADRLPSAMHPDAWRVVSRWPLTSSGKVDYTELVRLLD